MNLSGWSTWESEVKRQGALVIEFPTVGPLEFSDDERFAIVPFSTTKAAYDRRVRDLKQLFARARAYRTDGSALPDLKLEALQPVLRGELPVIIDANNRADIRAAVLFAKEEKLTFLLGGAAEAWHVADFLKENNVRVILGPSQAVPEGDDDPVDIMYRTAGILHQKGIPFAMSTMAMPGLDSWDLPYQVGYAVAHGLPYEAGLRSVTLTPAEFLGVADKLGSIEKGKMANLVVAEGDVFDYTTKIKHVFIQGRAISLDTHHTEEYERYKKR
jgi:imidazolonepropionase-like amidohydrolase